MKFDSTINLGHVMTITSMLLGGTANRQADNIHFTPWGAQALAVGARQVLQAHGGIFA